MALLLLASLAAGCGAWPNLPAGANFVENGEKSVIVMGVSPAIRVQVFPGVMNSEGWGLNLSDGGVLNNTPEGGYIVAPIKPSKSGETYGVNRILPPGEGILSVCTGGTTAVFEIPPGSIVYVGDLNLVSEGKYRIQIGYDFEKAAAFMRAKYPAMAARLVEGRARAAKVRHGECGGSSVFVVVVI
ncbi:MAG: hypothetical protein M0R80_30945 [Proteobacteria bacterium]|jgi:hypothetical protein|nr:hypothetical protein [Pseudomonadota bacterium]